MKLNGKNKDWPISNAEFNDSHNSSDLNISHNNNSMAQMVPKRNSDKKSKKKLETKSKSKKKDLARINEDEPMTKKTGKQFDEDKIYKKLEKSQRKLDKMVAKGRLSISDQPFGKESVVVENDPTKVIVINHRPASTSYKIFVRSYPLDFDFWCPVMLGVAFIVVLIFFTGFLSTKARSNKQFVIPYGSL
jgi:hypothetical protein